MSPGASTPNHLLREYLRIDSAHREASVARFIALASLSAIPFVLALSAYQDGTGIVIYCSILSGLAIYEVLLLRALRRGWFAPWIAWVNVAIEVSLPVPILIVSGIIGGPMVPVSSEVNVIWGALIMLSAVRSQPRLCTAAGILAAVEWLAIYALEVRPYLPEEPLITARPPSMLLRAVLLLITGLAGALIAQLFMRKAEEALRAVRAQDLMGKYFLHERLGSGGMAEVFRATYCPEGGFQKEVAIKRILPLYASNRDFLEMFREEARLCALLNHPNVVQVLDCGRFQDSFIVAMEFVEGASLQALLRRGDLPLAAVTFVGAELAAALDYIHRRMGPDGRPLSLVHRDVNPPNILISRIGEVKLTDFGVAHAATRVQARRSDRTFGKTQYSAPEQIRGEPLAATTDLFALGLTLHEALTGRRVLNAQVEDLLRRGELPPIPRPSFLRPEVPEPLDRLVMQLLEPSPARRPQSGAEVRERLLALTGSAAPQPEGQRALHRCVEARFPAGALAGGDTPLPLLPPPPPLDAVDEPGGPDEPPPVTRPLVG